MKVILSTVVVSAVVVIVIVVKARKPRRRHTKHDLSDGIYRVCLGNITDRGGQGGLAPHWINPLLDRFLGATP